MKAHTEPGIGMERVYTTQELAELLRIQHNGIHEFLVHKRVPFIRVNKGYLISEWDVNDLLEPKSIKIESMEDEQ